MLKKRRGRREPLHQYIVGVPMERLAMDAAGPYPITSTGNQYCLMVGCYFSKWLECFPIPDQKATRSLGSWYTRWTRGTKLQFVWFGPVLITKVLDRGRVFVRQKRDKPLTVVHVDRLEAYRGMAVPAWMTAERSGCVAV